MRARGPLLVLALGSSLVTRTSLADDVAQAKAHFAAAARAYEDNRFRVAIDAFEEAYRLAPRPAVLFSIAQAYKRQYFLDRQGPDLSRAIDHYRRYLKEDPKGKRVGEASAALADLEPMAARLGVDAEAKADQGPRPARLMLAPSIKGATGRVDGGAPIDLPDRIEVAPGRHTVVIEAEGYQTERREVRVDPGEFFALDVRMTERPAALRLPVEDGIRLWVDGRVVATTPVLKPVEVTPGPHAISLARRGHDPVSSVVDLRAGETRTMTADFSPSKQRIAAIVMIGGGALATVGGGVLVALALGAESRALEVEELSAEGNITPAERDEQADAISQRNVLRAAGIGALGGGALLAMTGALLYVVDDPEPGAQPAIVPARPSPRPDQPEMEVRVVPAAGPRFAGAKLIGAF